MAQYSTIIYADSFAYDEAKGLYYSILNTSSLTDFTGSYNFTALDILRIDGQKFKTILAHYEIMTNGDIYIYCNERINAKVVLVSDS